MTPYRGTLDVAMGARVSPERVRRDCSLGRLQCERPGKEYLFTPEQFEAALRYYRERRPEEGAGDGVLGA